MTSLLHIFIVSLVCTFVHGCETIGKYGSTCSKECHCADGVVCDPSIGCPFGPCEDGYSGENCQVHDTCSRSYRELCVYGCLCEDYGPCDRTTGSCGKRECRHWLTGNDCQLDAAISSTNWWQTTVGMKQTSIEKKTK
ncbi:multiple epidermal growth factor-like domains protein 10 [Anneissia japonica]|uniref:multiple epidermal growth factor-like domains protein 10 n=1 Tax=Anneissia japonica TaxID=1529436 RepID=UPI0014259335|nr:multiple epidermal growth factor-like domains protein 10 [Anneissia japonica]